MAEVGAARHWPVVGDGMCWPHRSLPRIRPPRGVPVTTTIKQRASKVPEITLLFWVFKIAATTLGETGGDAVSMSMKLGYLVATGIFAVIFLIAVGAQIAAKRFHPFLYWTTIVATTTVGTTLADFADRSLHIGYAGGTSLLFALLIASLAT
jgi:uncharacterized membrane-anchored protein